MAAGTREIVATVRLDRFEQFASDLVARDQIAAAENLSKGTSRLTLINGVQIDVSLPMSTVAKILGSKYEPVD